MAKVADYRPQLPARVHRTSGDKYGRHSGRAGHPEELCLTMIDPALAEQLCACGDIIYVRRQQP
ncbi:MAG: hypothetical protein ACHQ7N_08365 [Candidatus Methylomirabilales bacterium]